MEQKVSTENRVDTGYLVVERPPEAPGRIVFADGVACALAGIGLEDLLAADPAGVLMGLAYREIPLNGGDHTLLLLRSPEEEDLEQANSRLREELEAAEAANRAKSSFLSNMSHDIRTPMNAILGMTAIAQAHIDEKSRVQDSLCKIQTASNHLMSLVNDVLDMSRIDSGRMTINSELFSLADLVHDIAVILRPQAAQKQQSLQIEIGQIHEESLIGDPLRLRQILVNIIGNAVKYTQAGGEIQVEISQRLEDGDGRGGRVWVDFVCRDNGIGMSPDFLERIFQPFERVKSAKVNRIEGTGLGMAIVKSLVDRMGGTIQVESREGVGSCFRLELPMNAAPQERRSLGLPQGQPVLLVECQEVRAAQMADYLRSSGLEPVCLTTALSAVTWLTEAQYEDRMPCALVLGQELADMSVLELAAHARQLAGPSFPILLVSEADWAQIEYRAVRAGVDAFVPCPLFKSRLLETLSKLICGAQGERAGESGQTDYSGFRVLLVEDNELNQEIAVELLSMTGVQVETADNGLHALDIFRASPECYFDLIFMDIQMPVMDGYEAARQIRRLERGDARSVYIVAMTANAFVEDIRRSRDAGMDGHVSKPVDLEHLQEVLRTRLQRRESPVE